MVCAKALLFAVLAPLVLGSDFHPQHDSCELSGWRGSALLQKKQATATLSSWEERSDASALAFAQQSELVVECDFSFGVLDMEPHDAEYGICATDDGSYYFIQPDETTKSLEYGRYRFTLETGSMQPVEDVSDEWYKIAAHTLLISEDDVSATRERSANSQSQPQRVSVLSIRPIFNDTDLDDIPTPEEIKDNLAKSTVSTGPPFCDILTWASLGTMTCALEDTKVIDVYMNINRTEEDKKCNGPATVPPIIDVAKLQYPDEMSTYDIREIFMYPKRKLQPDKITKLNDDVKCSGGSLADNGDKGIGNELSACKTYCFDEPTCYFMNFKEEDGSCELLDSCPSEEDAVGYKAFKKKFEACSWSGFAGPVGAAHPSKLPRTVHRAGACNIMYKSDGRNWVPSASLRTHEIGHCMGFSHAYSKDVHNLDKWEEYGDSQNPMGSSGSTRATTYSPAQMESATWISEAEGHVKHFIESDLTAEPFKEWLISITTPLNQREGAYIGVKISCDLCLPMKTEPNEPSDVWIYFRGNSNNNAMKLQEGSLIQNKFQEKIIVTFRTASKQKTPKKMEGTELWGIIAKNDENECGKFQNMQFYVCLCEMELGEKDFASISVHKEEAEARRGCDFTTTSTITTTTSTAETTSTTTTTVPITTVAPESPSAPQQATSLAPATALPPTATTTMEPMTTGEAQTTTTVAPTTSTIASTTIAPPTTTAPPMATTTIAPTTTTSPAPTTTLEPTTTTEAQTTTSETPTTVAETTTIASTATTTLEPTTTTEAQTTTSVSPTTSTIAPTTIAPPTTTASSMATTIAPTTTTSPAPTTTLGPTTTTEAQTTTSEAPTTTIAETTTIASTATTTLEPTTTIEAQTMTTVAPTTSTIASTTIAPPTTTASPMTTTTIAPTTTTSPVPTTTLEPTTTFEAQTTTSETPTTVAETTTIASTAPTTTTTTLEPTTTTEAQTITTVAPTTSTIAPTTIAPPTTTASSMATTIAPATTTTPAPTTTLGPTTTTEAQTPTSESPTTTVAATTTIASTAPPTSTIAPPTTTAPSATTTTITLTTTTAPAPTTTLGTTTTPEVQTTTSEAPTTATPATSIAPPTTTAAPTTTTITSVATTTSPLKATTSAFTTNAPTTTIAETTTIAPTATITLEPTTTVEAQTTTSEAPTTTTTPAINVAITTTSSECDVHTPDTWLKVMARAGDTKLEVTTTRKLKVGDIIIIEKCHGLEENNEIIGFGSVVLKYPLKYTHIGGVAVTVIPFTTTTVEPADIGKTASLDASGYDLVAATCCNLQMDFFIRRLIQKEGMEICNEYGFLGLLPWYTCENQVQSYDELVQNLWASSPPKRCAFVAPAGACVALDPTCSGNEDKVSHRRRICN